MRIKVCGLQMLDQVQLLDGLVDYLGFIFYPNSPRFSMGTPSSKKSERVGVFVNEKTDAIISSVEQNELTLVQLHGSESVATVKEIRRHIPVIKAFGVHEKFDFPKIEVYVEHVDFFLFDTASKNHGGSGKSFDWGLLDKYTGEVPFFLSGGITPDSLERIRQFEHPQFFGLDLNSGFENSPGNKNLLSIHHFLQALNHEKQLHTT